ncbi:ApeA N-terminal domain 1-containing protein [Paraburkholderia metrosideri]|uniref:ApeA N-terminal domain-containing protein n=1 Tax=Paraburkholderia metrosideri TaxID=580937 RepID=A0ABM8P1K5_9BURK|nr:HEPN domain-containing protein [Paraburkholderia metrosideri]CAD6553483.1 hypothetical protein LMG28140_05298 [Paraburkholderia metrosideri]
MTTMEELELDEPGYFWWRDEAYPADHFASENGVTGRLKIKKSGEINLELDSVLPRKDAGHGITRVLGRKKGEETPRAIQGILKTSGRRVILVDAVYSGGQFHSHRFTWERYLATMCLLGETDFPSNRTIPTFSKIELNLTGLENWLVHGTLKYSSTRRTFRVRLDEYRGPVYQTPFGRLAFEKRTEVDGLDGMHHFKASVRELMTLTLRRSRSFQVEEVREEFVHLQDLFTVLSGSSYQLKWPSVVLSKGKRIYTLIFRRVGGIAKAPELHELPLKFDAIKSQFGDIYSAWREKREAFGPGFFYYLSTKRDAKMYVENHFSNLIQGLESFHRTKYGDKPVTGALQEKIDRIVAQVGKSDDRRWIRGKLVHACEPSLAERLSELFTALPIGIDHDLLKTFATTCAHLRNDIAHYGGLRSRTASASFLRDTSLKNEVVGYLYHMTLLNEIGLSGHAIKVWAGENLAGMVYRHYLVAIGFLKPAGTK